MTMVNRTLVSRLASTLLAVLTLPVLALCLASCDRGKEKSTPGPATQPAATQPASTQPVAKTPATQSATERLADGWEALFDGRSLAGWKVPKFGGEGKVYAKDGCLHLEMGEMCTGATYTGAVPRENYEVYLEFMRADGSDFPCALTFPVGKDPLTFVIGGWGGSIIGVSCIDGYDASDNPFSKFSELKDKTWYKVLVRVTKDKVECYLDDERMIDIPRSEHKFSIRPEVEECVPLGIAAWRTYGVIRNIRLRTIE